MKFRMRSQLDKLISVIGFYIIYNGPPCFYIAATVLTYPIYIEFEPGYKN